MQRRNLKNDMYRIERREIFSIRKFKVGVASALIGVSLFGGQAVLAQEENLDTNTVSNEVETSELPMAVEPVVEEPVAAETAMPAVAERAAAMPEEDVPAEETMVDSPAPASAEMVPVATELPPTEIVTDNTRPVDDTATMVTKYRINEDESQAYGYSDMATTADPKTNILTLGVKPVVVDEGNTVRTTRYEAGGLLYDKEAYPKYKDAASSTAPAHVVENYDGIEKIEKGQYTDLLKRYETVEVKEIRSLEDTFQVQQFGEEGYIDLNKVLEWMAKPENNSVATEFKLVDADGVESYLAIFRGADGRNWISTNKSDMLLASNAVPITDFSDSRSSKVVVATESENGTASAHLQISTDVQNHFRRNWTQLTHAYLERFPSKWGGLYNLASYYDNDSEGERNTRFGTPLLMVINDANNVEKRIGDNKAYLYNHQEKKEATYKISYRTTKTTTPSHAASPFADGDDESNRNRVENYVSSDWMSFNKTISLKPHVKYHTEVKNVGLYHWNDNITSDDSMKLAQNEYRKAILVDISPTTERQMIDGKEHYVYKEYGFNQMTGEKYVTNTSTIPVEEAPDDTTRTYFVSEGIALALPKWDKESGKGRVVLTNKPLLQVVYDHHFNINKQSILQDYYGVYDARRIANVLGEYEYEKVFIGEHTRRGTDMDDRTLTYGVNYRPYRDDVRNEMNYKINHKNAPSHRNVTITPNVTINHYTENGTLIKKEVKAATEILDPYYQGGSPEILKDYTYVRSTIDEQEYIYKPVKTTNPKYYTDGVNIIRQKLSTVAYEHMGTVAPPFFSATAGKDAGFALTYDNYAIVEAATHERADAVRRGEDPEYRVAEEARHIRTINVYYRSKPKNDVPEEYPTVTLPEAELVNKTVEGKVIVHYVDESGNVIANQHDLPSRTVQTKTYLVVDEKETLVDTVNTNEMYNVDNTQDKPATISFAGKTYGFKEVATTATVGDKKIVTEDNANKVFFSPTPTGTVVEGITHVIYVYKEIAPEIPGSVVVHYVNEAGEMINTDYYDTMNAKPGTMFNTEATELEKPKEIIHSGKTYVFKEISATATVGNKTIVDVSNEDKVYLSPKATGEVVPGTTHIVYVYNEKPADEKISVPGEYPTVNKPEAKITTQEVEGRVLVHYVDGTGKELKADQEIPTMKVGTEIYVDGQLADMIPTHVMYDATTPELKPEEITYKGVTYEYSHVLAGVGLAEPKAEYVEGTLHVTYVYLVKPENPSDNPGEGTPESEEPKPVRPPVVDGPSDPTEGDPGSEEPGTGSPEEPGTGSPEEPGTGSPEEPGIGTPEEPGTGSPEEPGTGTPEEPGTGSPEEPGTGSPEEPGTGNPEEPGTGTPEEPGTGSPEEPGTGSPEKPGAGSPEEPGTGSPEEPSTGNPIEGEPEGSGGKPSEDKPKPPSIPEDKPGKYVPYIPEDPSNPVNPNDPLTPPTDSNGNPIKPIDFDETPEDPTDNPPLPDVDGYIPVDPKDPTTPLKPKDPNDPTKGYEPPVPTNPNESVNIPYLPAGMVTVHYVDDNGNVIKDPTVDTPKSLVGTAYNTNENGTEIPKKLTGRDGMVYELWKVKDGDKEIGVVVQGNTDVTYIYKLKVNPENEKPEGGQPNGGIPGENQPGNGTPEGGQPNGGTPGENQPGNGTPEGGQPNGGTPGENQPGNETPEGGQPNGGTPGENQPGNGTPEGGQPNGGTPGENQPGNGTPEGGQPNGGTPGENQPGNGTPEGGQPNGGTPGENQPGNGTPEGGQPNGGTPGENQPGNGTPEGGQPNGGSTPGENQPGQPGEMPNKLANTPGSNDKDIQKSSMLPNTGEADSMIFLGAAALSVLTGIGLVATGRKKEEA
ncbi:MucBP domain-containing protein [Aerococcaceae bacterium zg-B36]|uniref:MucBP domain-containing protein n=1 Tax=Aerococcaceae bacterium zg-252 TaxID=2796928 RepID=UPI001BD8DFC4|nr:MucBP domain-containing protein [Aerococcaceae bacterium zg-B36]